MRASQTKRFAVDRRLARLTKLASALPEATRRLTGRHAAFIVRGKTFAYFLDDHHGDGIVALTCKVEPGANVALVASDARRFFLPSYLSSRGWVGLRLDRPPIDWDDVRQLLIDSYRMVAPKGLIAKI